MPSLEEPGQLVLTVFLPNILLSWEPESYSCQPGLGYMSSLGGDALLPLSVQPQHGVVEPQFREMNTR